MNNMCMQGCNNNKKCIDDNVFVIGVPGMRGPTGPTGPSA